MSCSWSLSSTSRLFDSSGNPIENTGQPQTNQEGNDSLLGNISNVATRSSMASGVLTLVGKAPATARFLGGPLVLAIGSTADVLDPNTSSAKTGFNMGMNIVGMTGPVGAFMALNYSFWDQTGMINKALDGSLATMYRDTNGNPIPGYGFGRSIR